MTTATERAGISRRLLGVTYRRMPGLLVAGLIGLTLTLFLTFFGEPISGFEASDQDLRARLLPPLSLPRKIPAG